MYLKNTFILSSFPKIFLTIDINQMKKKMMQYNLIGK